MLKRLGSRATPDHGVVSHAGSSDSSYPETCNWPSGGRLPGVVRATGLTGDAVPAEGRLLVGDFSAMLRPFLQRIAAITCHARNTGRGKRTRYEFLRGEIYFGANGGVTKDSNVARQETRKSIIIG